MSALDEVEALLADMGASAAAPMGGDVPQYANMAAQYGDRSAAANPQYAQPQYAQPQYAQPQYAQPQQAAPPLGNMAYAQPVPRAGPVQPAHAVDPNSITSFDALDSMMNDFESHRISMRPGAMTAANMTGAGAVMVQSASDRNPNTGVAVGPGGVAGRGISAGPGAARGMSSGPGAARGMSSGPGAARGGMSSGPGAARGISSGPGAMMSNGPGAGRGVVSAGPGPAALAAQKQAQDANKIVMATHMPGGRKLEYSGPPCYKCKEPIIGKVTNALDRTYHPECFNCFNCEKKFLTEGYIEQKGEPYCDDCFWELFGPKCCRCGGVVKEKCINALGRAYHAAHFSCTGCGTELAGKKYKEFDSEPYCSECFEDRKIIIEPAAHICGLCKKPIFGWYIKLNGLYMHPEHYKCEACGCEFTNGNCLEYDGKLYCEPDWRKLLKSVCFGCRKPIAGRSITAMGRVWHPEHFVCAHCHEPFASSNFFENDGKPYCDVHYALLFAKVCDKCTKPIIGESVFSCGKYFHHEHYVCTYCDIRLDKKKAMEWDNKPMCNPCFGKLPKDVRDKVLAMRAAKKKAKRLRETNEKKQLREEAKAEQKAAKQAAKAGPAD